VRYDEGFHLVSDPFRRPQDLIGSLVSPIGSFIDKAKVGVYSLFIRTKTVPDILDTSEVSTVEYLRGTIGVSDEMIDRFFRPFYQGIYLSPLEKQSSRMFEFVFKMFTEGSATLPAAGMGQGPLQVAADIDGGADRIMLNTKVRRIATNAEGGYDLTAETVFRDNVGTTTNAEGQDDGSSSSSPDGTPQPIKIVCKNVVVAADPVAARGLLSDVTFTASDTLANSPAAAAAAEGDDKADGTGGTAQIDLDLPKARGSTCVYFGFDGPPPVTDPMLILNGENRLTDEDEFKTTINNVCFPSQVSSAYAPPGKSLASVTLVGCVASSSSLSDDIQLGKTVLEQLEQWWGKEVVAEWKLLKVYRIPYAQPAQTPPYAIEGQPVALRPPAPQKPAGTGTDTGTADHVTVDHPADAVPVAGTGGLYCVGDHRASATLNGAIASGRRAAEQILQSQ